MKIGEVAAATGTTAKTLRFYERAGLLPPPRRTSAGYRQYSPDIVARMDFIRRSQAAGFSLAQIRTILDIRDSGDAPCRHVQGLLDERLEALDRQLTELAALRGTVAHLRAQARTIEPDTCDPATVCRYL
ncbi:MULTISPECIES: heavy metal-responsive transcriptional regulator [Modestobacter]|uniref:MerR family transcriptional regulator n=1 Tax=Modestobacter caceresii TaxID=1522368 RepID=A0A098Y4G7_9ACTN|nr:MULTISPECIES: heavy metal-responsive transcriptional regulator [Modestobacter]KGH45347.1 MerR family transcriptional regulator [Modestobacter caceresii]